MARRYVIIRNNLTQHELKLSNGHKVSMKLSSFHERGKDVLRSRVCPRVNEHLGQTEENCLQLTIYKGLGVSGVITWTFQERKNKGGRVKLVPSYFLWKCSLPSPRLFSNAKLWSQQCFRNCLLLINWASLVAQRLKHLPPMRETRVRPWVGKIPWRRKW